MAGHICSVVIVTEAMKKTDSSLFLEERLAFVSWIKELSTEYPQISIFGSWLRSNVGSTKLKVYHVACAGGAGLIGWLIYRRRKKKQLQVKEDVAFRKNIFGDPINRYKESQWIPESFEQNNQQKVIYWRECQHQELQRQIQQQELQQKIQQQELRRKIQQQELQRQIQQQELQQRELKRQKHQQKELQRQELQQQQCQWQENQWPEPTNIVVVTDTKRCDESIKQLLRKCRPHGAVGFDCEWLSRGRRSPVALLQLASHDGFCVLFRLNIMETIPDSLKNFLGDETIYKLGVGCVNDAKYLLADYSINVRCVLDINHVARYHGHKPGGLATLAATHLGVALDKDRKVSWSNWEARVLTDKQITYAAHDALAAVRIFQKFLRDAAANCGGLGATENVWNNLGTYKQFADLKFRD